MKKEVLLVTILTIVISLSAVVYSAALTNPGHGVEEIGSGSSPYAPFRDWNVLEAGYEDQYSGPSGLKSNVFWLATTNAQTLAAQNSSEDWCALQVHPSGIYMNCFNNASNMTLFNSYYWNGTNFTKNDTIKNGTNTIEKKVLQVNGQGGQEIFSLQELSGDSVTINTFSNPTGTGQSTTATSGTSTGTASIAGDTITIGNTDLGPGSSGTITINSVGSTEITAGDGTNEEGSVAVDGGGTVTVTGTDGAGTGNTGGKIDIGDNIDMSVSAGGVADLFKMVSNPTATGGQGVTTILDDTGVVTLFEKTIGADANGGIKSTDIFESGAGNLVYDADISADAAGSGQSTEIVYGTAAGGDDLTISLFGESAATSDPSYSVIGKSGGTGANIFNLAGDGDNTGAGSFSISAPDAGGNIYSLETNGISQTTTMSADASSVSVDGAADTVTISNTAGTFDENGYAYHVIVAEGELSDSGAGAGASVAIPGVDFCKITGKYMTAGPTCILATWDYGVSAPGTLTIFFADMAAGGANCAGVAAYQCGVTS